MVCLESSLLFSFSPAWAKQEPCSGDASMAEAKCRLACQETGHVQGRANEEIHR